MNRKPLTPDDKRHGTYNAYHNYGCRCAEAEARDNHGTETRYKLGCRCDLCTAAVTAARRARRHQNRDAYNAWERAYRRRKRNGRIGLRT